MITGCGKQHRCAQLLLGRETDTAGGRRGLWAVPRVWFSLAECGMVSKPYTVMPLEIPDTSVKTGRKWKNSVKIDIGSEGSKEERLWLLRA